VVYTNFVPNLPNYLRIPETSMTMADLEKPPPSADSENSPDNTTSDSHGAKNFEAQNDSSRPFAAAAGPVGYLRPAEPVLGCPAAIL